jgi:translocator protein
MPFVICALLTAAAAGFGAMFMPGAWYQTLLKPTWTPPNWLFGPVWTTLYVMIAIAGGLAWRSDPSRSTSIIWAIGLILNAAWSYIFFGQHLIGVALADIVLLWCAILAFIVTAWTYDKRASLLFVPYLAWVSLATALNFTIWRMN